MFGCPKIYKWISKYICTGEWAQIRIIFEGYFIKIFNNFNICAHHWFPGGNNIEKKDIARFFLTLFVLILGHFWCSVVTSVTFSRNLSYFEKTRQNPTKKIENIRKNSIIKKSKNMKNSQQSPFSKNLNFWRQKNIF